MNWRLIGIVAFVLSFCGCAGLVETIVPPPGIPDSQPFEPIDEDGDGEADVCIYVEQTADPATGQVAEKPLLDESTGRPVEVPGSRATLTRAAVGDKSVGDSLTGLGIAFGLPALTGIGLLVRNLKLGRKATTAALYLKGVVRSVQNYRDQLPEEQRLAMGRVLTDSQRMVDGLQDAVQAAKEPPQEQ